MFAQTLCCMLPMPRGKNGPAARAQARAVGRGRRAIPRSLGRAWQPRLSPCRAQLTHAPALLSSALLRSQSWPRDPVKSPPSESNGGLLCAACARSAGGACEAAAAAAAAARPPAAVASGRRVVQARRRSLAGRAAASAATARARARACVCVFAFWLCRVSGARIGAVWERRAHARATLNSFPPLPRRRMTSHQTSDSEGMPVDRAEAAHVAEKAPAPAAAAPAGHGSGGESTARPSRTPFSPSRRFPFFTSRLAPTHARSCADAGGAPLDAAAAD
jgi:hypothetical protein